ncbi:hypothetical protein [Sporosarcina sp. NCCP-2222]|nr:hypothetical protein [Sporosarcina sp. NCCP-2222]
MNARCAGIVTSGMNEYTRGSQNIRAVAGIYEWFQNYSSCLFTDTSG